MEIKTRMQNEIMFDVDVGMGAYTFRCGNFYYTEEKAIVLVNASDSLGHRWDKVVLASCPVIIKSVLQTAKEAKVFWQKEGD
jgi:hypothetical protein